MGGLRDLVTRIRHHEITGQFVRYALIGCMNFAVTLLVFTVLGRSVPAVAAAFIVSNTMSFFLNKHWAFRDRSSHAVVRQYVLFFLFTLVGLGISTGGFALFRIPLARFGVIGRYEALIACLPFVVLWNFTAYRRWTFNAATAAAAGPGSA